MTGHPGLDEVTADVTGIETVVDSAIAFIGGLHEKLVQAMDEDGLDSDSSVGELAAGLEAHSAALSAAIVANTDAAPAPAPAPVEASGGSAG